MAQRIILHYVPGFSPLHRWDARCKLLGLLMITATLLPSKSLWFLFDSGILIWLLILSRLPLRQFLRDFWIWIIFLLILFMFQALITPGSRLSAFSWLPISQEGLRLGIFTTWRLSLILGYSILFTAVTRPRELQDTLIYFLNPIPFIPARRIGLMVSLTLRFFSLILDQAEEVRLAHRARLGDRNKNPFRRAKFLALPLLIRSFSQAEEVTLALAARGYQEDLPLKVTKIPLAHLTPLLIFLGILMMIGWFDL
jgi:biotin transport system permease protein